MSSLPLVSKQAWDKPQRSGLLYESDSETSDSSHQNETLASIPHKPPQTQTELELRAQLFWLGVWGETVGACRIPGSAGASQKPCPEDAAHQPWRAASKLACGPLPLGREDGRQQRAGVRGPPLCRPLISTNEFLCGKEQTAPQWDWPRLPQRGSLVSRAC